MSFLKFHARGDMLVREPGSVHMRGAQACYVGRKWDQAAHGFPAVEEPYCVKAGTDDAERLKLLCVRDACLWPADAETAAACGVPFTHHKLVDGSWIADPQAE